MIQEILPDRCRHGIPIRYDVSGNMIGDFCVLCLGEVLEATEKGELNELLEQQRRNRPA